MTEISNDTPIPELDVECDFEDYKVPAYEPYTVKYLNLSERLKVIGPKGIILMIVEIAVVVIAGYGLFALVHVQ